MTSAPQRLPVPPDLSHITVLVVDPRGSSRAATVELLQETGYNVKAVKSGAEAITILEDRVQACQPLEVDIILKEHDPPHSNALRFLQKLRGMPQLAFVPVIVVSNHDDRSTVVRCLAQGAADYWIKPLRSNEVRNLWTRVWWRKSGPDAPTLPPNADGVGESSGDASDETRNRSPDGLEPTSKEGSAPDGAGGSGQAADPTNANGSGHGSGHGNGGSGSDEDGLNPVPAHNLAGSEEGGGKEEAAAAAGNGDGSGNMVDGSTTGGPARHYHHHHHHHHHHSRRDNTASVVLLEQQAVRQTEDPEPAPPAQPDAFPTPAPRRTVAASPVPRANGGWSTTRPQPRGNGGSGGTTTNGGAGTGSSSRPPHAAPAPRQQATDAAAAAAGAVEWKTNADGVSDMDEVAATLTAMRGSTPASGSGGTRQEVQQSAGWASTRQTQRLAPASAAAAAAAAAAEMRRTQSAGAHGGGAVPTEGAGVSPRATGSAPLPRTLLPPQFVGAQAPLRASQQFTGQFPPPPSFQPMPPFMQPPMPMHWAGPGSMGAPGSQSNAGGAPGAQAQAMQLQMAMPPFPFPSGQPGFAGAAGQTSSQATAPADMQALMQQQQAVMQYQQQQYQMMTHYNMAAAAMQQHPYGQQAWRQPGGGTPPWPTMQPPPGSMAAQQQASALPAAAQAAGSVPLGGDKATAGTTTQIPLTSNLLQGSTPPADHSGAGGTPGADSRREARQQALHKYKEKRKNLNASTKIRYQSRKALAEARPRVRGQFVRLSKDTEASSGPGMQLAGGAVEDGAVAGGDAVAAAAAAGPTEAVIDAMSEGSGGESATQSMELVDGQRHRQGDIALHPHQRDQLTGNKHGRQASEAAPPQGKATGKGKTAGAKAGGRSDSGSNSGDDGEQAPAKHQHLA